MDETEAQRWERVAAKLGETGAEAMFLGRQARRVLERAEVSEEAHRWVLNAIGHASLGQVDVANDESMISIALSLSVLAEMASDREVARTQRHLRLDAPDEILRVPLHHVPPELRCTFKRAYQSMCGRPPNDEVHAGPDDRMGQGRHVWRHE